MTSARIFRPEPAGGIKWGMQAADHDGWYVLDGRSLAGFTRGQRRNALDLYGWTTNLPDMRNAEVMDTGAAMGTVAGSDSVSLTLANLPAYTMSGNMAQVDNNHNHGQLLQGDTHVLHPNVYNRNFRSAGNGNQRGARNLSVASGGAHSHTFGIPSGGTGAGINTENPYYSANLFAFLGA